MFSLISDDKVTVNINDQKYLVDFTFPTVLKFFDILEDKKLNDIDKIYSAFLLFIGEVPNVTIEQMAKAVNQIVNLITFNPYDDNNDESNVNNNIARGKSCKPHSYLFSYKKDASVIYASFMYDYQIDLLKNQDMSWFKFKALFDNLSENSPLMRLISIRQTDTSKMENNEERNRIEQLQRKYSLLSKEEKQKRLIQQQNHFGDLLMNLIKQDQAKKKGDEINNG